MFEMDFDHNDLAVVKRVVTSDEFADYILGKTTTLQQAAFILQTLVEKCDEVEKQFEEE